MNTNRKWPSLRPALLALGLLPVASRAAEAPRPPETARVVSGDTVESVIAEFDEAMTAFREKYFAASTDEERGKIYQESYPDPGKWFERLLALAEAAPGSDEAVQALIWIVQHDNGQNEIAKAAGEYLKHDYLMHARIGDYCDSLEGSIDPEGIAVLRQVLAENPAAPAKASAAFALGKCLMQQAELAETLAGNDGADWRTNLETYYGKDAVAALAQSDPAALRKEAEAMFERVVEHFAGVEGGRGKYSERADAVLFELRHLQVGMAAPDILGEDIEGSQFKLSDYRGKVVMLDFWGHW